MRAALLILLTHDLISVSMFLRTYASTEATGSSAKSSSSARAKGGNRGGRGGRSKKQTARQANEASREAANVLAENVGVTTETDVAGAEFGGFRYEFRPVAALRRLRHPRYVTLAHNSGGEAAAACVRALLQHGPWHKAAAVAEAARLLTSGGSSKRRRVDSSGSGATVDEAEEAAGAGVDQRMSHEEAHAAATQGWDAMVASGLIAPAVGLSVAFPALLLAGTLPGGQRLGAGVGAEDVVARGKTGGMKAGLKRKASTDGAEYDSSASKGPLFAFHWSLADRMLRNLILVRYIAEGPGAKRIPGAGHVLTAALHVANPAADRSSDGSVRAECSAWFRVKDVVRRLKVQPPLEADRALAQAEAQNDDKKTPRVMPYNVMEATEPSVDAVLSMLSELTHHFTQPSAHPVTHPGDRQYCVTIAEATMAVQLRALQGLISARYDGLIVSGSAPAAQGAGTGSGRVGGDVEHVTGLEVSRVLRLLLEMGQLDEKAVAENAMVEPKTARAVLFRLLTDGLLTTLEVPKRPDRAPQHTVFVFVAVSSCVRVTASVLLSILSFQSLTFPLSLVLQSWDRILPVIADWCCGAILRMRVRARMEEERALQAERTGEVAPGPSITEWDDMVRVPPAPEGWKQGGAVSSARGTASSQAKVQLDEDTVDAIGRVRRGVQKLHASILRTEETFFLLGEL